MTVSTISTLSSGSDSSAKLLKNSDNSTATVDSGLSFNATMNQTSSNNNFDEQGYMLADGQVLTADQLLEMLENGNVLPGLNLPPIAELQQLKTQTAIAPAKFEANMASQIHNKAVNIESSKIPVIDKFSVSQQQFFNQQFNQSQLIQPGATLAKPMLVAFDNVNSSSSISHNMTANGFSVAYGYQTALGPEGSAGLMSNTFSINTPVQTPQWSQSLGQSVQWMVNQNMQHAEIKLNPPDLGLLDIRVTVNNDQASVTFVAPNAAVREALESAMPKLREMLEESGVSLADVNVSEHSLEHSEEQQDSDSQQERSNAGEDGDSTTVGVANNSMNNIHIGLLDTYA